MNFIDYHAASPKEELKNAFFRTNLDGLGKFGSLKGRAICLLKVATHTSCIVLKPLRYLIIGSLSVLLIHLLAKGKLKGPSFDKDPFFQRIRVSENNPEFKKRVYSTLKDMMLCAPVAVLSQVIQVIKAVFGIFHPGFYFKNDPLTPLMQRLAAVARTVGCQNSLIQELDKGSKAINISGTNNAYIRVKYIQYLNAIVTKLEDTNIPNSQKLRVLSLLNIDEDTDISGIQGCIAGLGRVLKDMDAMLNVPENPADVVSFLLEKLKMNIITQMVLAAEYSHKEPANWKNTVNNIGWDQSHRGAALTSVIGTKIGLSQEAISMANQDTFVAAGIKLIGNQQQELLNEFNARFEKQKMPYLSEAINSSITEVLGTVDVSPGLRIFREKVIMALANSLTPEILSLENLSEGDEGLYVERIYQQNNGIGDRSEIGFNNLNDSAIQFVLDHPNCFAAF